MGVNTCRRIAEHYGKHCISLNVGFLTNMLNIVPAKIVTGLNDLEPLHNSKCTEHLCFLHMFLEDRFLYMYLEDPVGYGWRNYKNIFDQCSSLKEISITLKGKSLKDNFPEMTEQNKAIWQERISYFEKRGIKIVEKDEIYENENLLAKVAQEAGVTWKF